jgi:hypothetical protein
MRTIFRSAFILVISIYVDTSIAGSITCKGHIIEDDTLEPVSKNTVREKCGEPISSEFGTDIFHMPNGTKIMVRYNASHEVQSIEEVSK